MTSSPSGPSARRISFVLGGARSGKSRFSEDLADKTGLERHYVATSQIFDEEMRARIDRHRADRGEGWVTHEEPVRLAEVLVEVAQPDRIVLVDCLTLWVTNLMMAEADVDAEGRALVESLALLSGPVIFVSNEVGLGIVPDNRMARAFRDHAGRLHQNLAAAADEVFFIAAGLPLKMKG
ncbi:bifunctional adenosylcobinamide kinase/adenosylcobinamide-phosphate guanylyltransferase [Affinirhizobium pseudoryzae]|uniref:bifunctional adenosylcobinamide kinase/adenosylcobinamide-phosphate guanylyltransferase n=1 Tax=Allorhizobium pseudoryzae TaxID=379684 RepID=UPI0013EB8538|nr:bifunctional adenosylcobinamide kinase/adenosylcobinamide-phosphate guanylyltransferase [Allorhizobium pseudoryzae]